MTVLLEILRPLNVLITGISAAVAYSLASSLESTAYNRFHLLLVILATSLTAGAGNLINDLYDIKIDRINKPERPLPQGRISVSGAISYYLLLVAVAVLCGWFLSMHSFAAVIGVNILLYTYASYWKKSLLAKNLLVATVSAYLFYFCSITTGNALKILPLAAAAFLFHLIREIIKDMADLDGDRQEMAKTLIIRFGSRVTVRVVRILIIMLLGYLTVAALIFDYKIYFHLLIILTILPVLLYVFVKIRSAGNSGDYEKLSRIMKYDMLCGLLAFYVGIV